MLTDLYLYRFSFNHICHGRFAETHSATNEQATAEMKRSHLTGRNLVQEKIPIARAV